MPDGDRHAHAGELLRDRARLFGIAGIVADLELELFPQHTAGGVDVGDGLLGAIPHLPAERGLTGGHRTGGGNPDVVGGRRRNGER